MIGKCHICQSDEYDSSGLCGCGYSFKEDEIADKDKTKVYYKNLKESKNWIEAAKFTKKLHEFQQKKKGKTTFGARRGWRYQDTAKLLGEKNISIVSDNINLAIDSEEHPELLNCNNRTQAIRWRRNKLTSGIISIHFEKYGSEEEFQKYLETNWGMTSLGEEWELRKSHVNVGDAGEIDLLAYHRREDCWLVVELKKDKTSDDTVGQILRYMGWFKENRAGKNERVQGIIIYGYPPDEHLRYALLYTPDVKQKVYYCLKGETIFMDAEYAYGLLNIEKLPIDQQKKIFDSVKK